MAFRDPTDHVRGGVHPFGVSTEVQQPRSSYTPTGVIGRPSLATAEKGKAVLDHLVTASTSYLENLTRAVTP